MGVMNTFVSGLLRSPLHRWRNFTTDGDVDVLLRRRWMPMIARAVIGARAVIVLCRDRD